MAAVNAPGDTSQHSSAIYQSLIEGPLLVGDLPEAASFDRDTLGLPDDLILPAINLKQKLGHLYEDALANMLRASPRYDLLASNLQIQKDAHTTIGELDFLLRDLESGKRIHLELATKFYLAVQTEDGLTLPGPDARDSYFKKLDRLRAHQLRILAEHEEHLPEVYRESKPTVTQQLLYGCFFDHIDTTQPAEPEFSHPQGRRGRWLTIDEIPNHFPRGTKFQIIPKALWPVPLKNLEKISLENWSPEASLERCLMLRIDREALPHFIAPTGYPFIT